MQRHKALNDIRALSLPFCIALCVCWRGGGSGEWVGPGSEKPLCPQEESGL